ncbi:Peroxisome biosynthesis protein [Yarrowia sp. C11]|nr:Peroxisome biosynthesis protein [Yarrowia sp. E02]KAG5371725.1 Peroxisome biosynthesis protein [Yarrowia sp. C11]
MAHSALVGYAPLRSGLVNIPTSLSSLIFNSGVSIQDVILSLSWQSKPSVSGTRTTQIAYVGWTGMTSKSDYAAKDKIELDPVFAKSINLLPNTQVSIDIQLHPKIAHTIHLEPVTVADWEIVELHAAYLESRMINQVRAVSINQPITVYPSSTTSATLKVLRIEPDLGAAGFAKLSPDSEVVVAPKQRKKEEKQVKKRSGSARSTGSQKRKGGRGPQALKRAISQDFEGHLRLEMSLDVSQLPPEFHQLKNLSVKVITPPNLASPQQAVSIAVEEKSEESSAQDERLSSEPKVEVPPEIINPASEIVTTIVDDNSVPAGHAKLSYALADALGIPGSVGHVIRLESASKPLSQKPGALVIHRFITKTVGASEQKSLRLKGEKSNDDAVSAEDQYPLLEKLKKLHLLEGPISNYQRLPPIPELLPLGGVIGLQNSEGWIQGGYLGEDPIPFVTGSEILRSESSLTPLNTESLDKRVVGLDVMLDKINEVLSRDSIGCLVYGSRGSGKSAVLSHIKKGCKASHTHTVSIACGLIAQDRVQAVREVLTKAFLEASWFAPSVLFLDDIDALMPAEVEHADSSRTRQLTQLFLELALPIMKSRHVSIVASAQAKESLHMNLVTGHVFEELFHLKSPDKEARLAILSEAVNLMDEGAPFSQNDILEIASQVDGYLPGDLWTLSERAQHEMALRQIETGTENSSIQLADFNKALEDFVPSSLRGVKLQKSNVKWNDIGGLKETKAVLLETLEWPTKYAPIFASCPLRLRSGLLLYGYPGCGKTYLASAVAAQCGLNFISIKGPEILNKYIGASEQSVRELFERAQAAKPCILFFDEFDSIAPKRGHDSTGVTDRVVNQMLTQMDGAEGLDGVYVLAATSRPDLIDPALLRPGRLDKMLICDLPSYEDRLDILRAIVDGKMSLDEKVELEYVASRTDGFSGADLQAVMFNAYLEAIHEVVDVADDTAADVPALEDKRLEFFQTTLGASKKEPATGQNEVMNARAAVAEKARVTAKLEALFKGMSVGDETDEEKPRKKAVVVIKPQHMNKSLDDTSPSISKKELMKLKGIYSQFVSGRSGDMPPGTASTDVGGRATLA